MKTALEKQGYRIVDNVEVGKDYYDDDGDPPRTADMVYYGDLCLTEGWRFERLYGTKRVEELFKEELKNRLFLLLFS